MSSPTRIPILIAEDDPDDRELLKEAFAHWGFAGPLDFLEDGEEVMALLNGASPLSHVVPMPELLLLDLNMPRKDGLEVLAEIRANAELCSLPVVILSTSSDPRDIAAAYQAGANSFITKPSSYHALVAIIGSLSEYWLTTVALPEKKATYGGQ